MDEPTPKSRARPSGALGAEVWGRLVDAHSPAPTDPGALTLLTMTTKPSFRAKFKAGDENHDGDGGGPREVQIPPTPPPKRSYL